MQSEFALPREIEDRVAAEMLAPELVEPGMHPAELHYVAARGIRRTIAERLKRRRGLSRDQRAELSALLWRFDGILESAAFPAAMERMSRLKLW